MPRHGHRDGGDGRAQRHAGGDQREAAAADGRGRRARRVERGILREDRLLELAQLPPGLEAQLVDERAPRGAEALQRLRLAARPVEREHLLRAQALAQRVLAHQPFELGHEPGMTPEPEVSLDALFDRREPQLLQARRFVLREPLVRKLAERRPAPQRERRVQQRGGARRVGRARLFEETARTARHRRARRRRPARIRRAW